MNSKESFILKFYKHFIGLISFWNQRSWCPSGSHRKQKLHTECEASNGCSHAIATKRSVNMVNKFPARGPGQSENNRNHPRGKIVENSRVVLSREINFETNKIDPFANKELGSGNDLVIHTYTYIHIYTLI